MFETTGRHRAIRLYFLITRAKLGHFGVINLVVVQRCRPIRPALKYLEVTHLVGDLADDLDCSCSSSDDSHPSVGEVDFLVRPVICVIGITLEIVDPVDIGHCRLREQAGSHD